MTNGNGISQGNGPGNGNGNRDGNRDGSLNPDGKDGSVLTMTRQQLYALHLCIRRSQGGPDYGQEWDPEWMAEVYRGYLHAKHDNYLLFCETSVLWTITRQMNPDLVLDNKHVGQELIEMAMRALVHPPRVREGLEGDDGHEVNISAWTKGKWDELDGSGGNKPDSDAYADAHQDAGHFTGA